MGSDRYRQSLLIHLGGLFATCCVLAWLLQSTTYHASAFLVLFILVVQIVTLIRYLNRTDRAVSRFLTSVQYEDFGQNFDDTRAPNSFRELGQAMENIIKGVNRARREKAEQAQYLQVLVQHIPIAVMAVREDGSVSLFNNAARRLLGFASLSHTDGLRDDGDSLADAIMDISAGEERMVRASTDKLSLQLSISATSLKLGGVVEKIISIQDLREPLESRESEAWQNLIRVLNHEIMNSMTPITSLASTGRESVGRVRSALNLEPDDPLDSDLEDVSDALDAMGKRSEGLMRFVSSYRSLNQLPTARMRPIRLEEFVERVGKLLAHALEAANIEWHTSVTPPGLELSGDAELLEQAVINLLNNSIDAVSQTPQPTISLTALLATKGRITIAVEDNGCGMDAEVVNNIFVPFFTTKREGTGVGMSLVRRIVRLQGGQVHVHSKPDAGTTISLVF